MVEKGEDTAPKAEKKKSKAPNAAPYKMVILKELSSDEADWPATRTTANPAGNSTQAERAWLRDKYGNDWSKAAPVQKQRMILQARKALAFEFAPKIEQAIKEIRYLATMKFQEDNYNEINAPKLNWKTECVPALNAKYPPNWQLDEEGKPLSEEEKQERSDAVKAELKHAKIVILALKAQEYVNLKEQEMRVRTIEELNNPDVMYKRRARALCRHWFNRLGTDGNPRVWWAGPGSDVTDALAAARMSWATSEVAKLEYDPTNPPPAPLFLYTPLDVKPNASFQLQDGVATISDGGGEYLWTLMRSMEMWMSFYVDTTYSDKPLISIDDFSSKYWDVGFRARQDQMIISTYSEFIGSLDSLSEIPDAKHVAVSYTHGSGKFNKYLLWPSDQIDGNPANIPDYGSGYGGAMGSMLEGQIGPPSDLHRLYKLLNRCPRLQKPAVCLRAVRNEAGLLHNLGKTTLKDPTIGEGYLNVTFMSTTVAAPDEFLSGLLGGFYNKYEKCCISVITVPAGFPVLPLVVGGTDTSYYATEKEVLLPPGLVFVYQGERMMPIGSSSVKVYFYQAFPQPILPVDSPEVS